jgi:predicted nuclease of predicted toxin-antitoxin system
VKLYLDEMIAPAVARELQRRGHDALAAVERDALGASDTAQLARAINEQRALATYNISDFVLLARAAAAAGRAHWGIVPISARTLPPSDIGGLVRAFEALLAKRHSPDALKDLTVFLPPAG